jgi:hypothetical protein
MDVRSDDTTVGIAALTLQYDKVLYLVDTIRENQRLAGKRVTVIDYPDGRIKIRYDG